jgi:hypothetical protein
MNHHLFIYTIGFLVQMSRGLNPFSSHACSCTPSFLRTLKQVLKSIGSFNVIWLLIIRLAFTWEWISFSNCLGLLLVIGPAISSVFGVEWMLGMSSLLSLCQHRHLCVEPLRHARHPKAGHRALPWYPTSLQSRATTAMTLWQGETLSDWSRAAEAPRGRRS